MTAEGLGTPDPDVSATDDAPAEGAAPEPFDAPDAETNDDGPVEADEAAAGPATDGDDANRLDVEDGEEVRYKKVPLLARLEAWWKGYEFVPEVDDEPENLEFEEEFDETDLQQYMELDEFKWSEQRADAVESVWGEGLVGPSGGEQILDMVKPMGLDPSKSVLDLSAGLGGGMRLVSQTFGAWVTGLEQSPNLAKLGQKKSIIAGMSKRASVEACDLENLELSDGTYDCIYARELFFTVKRKADLFQALFDALKVDGELAFTDFVLAEPDSETEAIRKWIAGEPVEPHPWSIEEAMEAMGELRLDVRVNEDITEDYRALVVKGLEDLIHRRKSRGPFEAKFAPAMLEEAELWARRVDAIDSGDVRVYRFLARRPEMGQEGLKSMSDW